VFDAKRGVVPLHGALVKLYEQTLTQKDTDVEFRIQDQSIHAHRNVLCCRCPYLRELIINSLMEANKPSVIQLLDVDHETFSHLIYFIYHTVFPSQLTLESATKLMQYANRIAYEHGELAATQRITQHMRRDHQAIFAIYKLIKPLSPRFNSLLEYLYDLCAHHFADLCQLSDFVELDKDSLIDLTIQSSARRERHRHGLNLRIIGLETNCKTTMNETEYDTSISCRLLQLFFHTRATNQQFCF
jgi:hypothetical protein